MGATLKSRRNLYVITEGVRKESDTALGAKVKNEILGQFYESACTIHSLMM